MDPVDLIGGTPPAATPPPAAVIPPPATAPPEAGQIIYPENFPSEFHGDPSITKFYDKESKTFNQGNMMTSLLHAQKMVGADKMLVPTKDTSTEDWAKIYSKLGLPERENYKLGIEGVNETDDVMTKGFIDAAHKAGVLPHQAKDIVTYFNEMSGEQEKQSKAESDQAYNDSLENLKSEWGNKFEENVQISNVAIENLLSEDISKAAKEAGYFADPLFVKMMHAIAPKLMDDQTLSGSNLEGSGYSSNTELISEYKSISANPAYKTNPTLQKRHAELLSLAIKKGLRAEDLM